MENCTGGSDGNAPQAYVDGFVAAVDLFEVLFSNPMTAETRLSQVEKASGEILTVAVELPGTTDDERRMHVLCGAERVAGEWFRNEGAVADILRCKAAA